MKLELQNNNFVTLPSFIFELPHLKELNLNHNKLQVIPSCKEWSQELSILDLSHNELTFLPSDIKAESLERLDLSHNHFKTVPSCVCSFLTLTQLNISFNRDILSLPLEMGRLYNLKVLGIKGLKDLSEPPRHMQWDVQECIHYLNTRLRKAQRSYRMKLVLLGDRKTGKSTLASRLQGLDFEVNYGSNVSLDITEWQYADGIGKKRYQFDIWDFNVEDNLSVIHQCFLSQRTMYILLWNVTHGEEGIKGLTPWLDIIALRAPHSCVLIVGTHLDLIQEEQELIGINQLMEKIVKIAQNYEKTLFICDVSAVGLMNQFEQISSLRDAIYNQASVYKGQDQFPFMGQEVPGSYITLQREIEKCQNEVRSKRRNPVMNVKEFSELIKELKIDINEGKDTRDVIRFLNDIGTIVHYEYSIHHIDDLLFIDPSWLYTVISSFISDSKSFVQNGILHSRNIPHLLRQPMFSWKYFNHFIALFDLFEIALPLDGYHVLIPSTLHDIRPEQAYLFSDTPNDTPLYKRQLVFPNCYPIGFWSRLISYLMHSLPELYHALGLVRNNNNTSNVHVHPNTATSITNVQLIEEDFVSIETRESFVTIDIPPQEEFFMRSITPAVRFIGTNSEGVYVNDNTEVFCWSEGVVYKGPELSFSVEPFHKINFEFQTVCNGITITTSPNEKGVKTMCELIDIIINLINIWYPTLASYIEQYVPCYECHKLGCDEPYEFNVIHYKSIAGICSYIECEHCQKAVKLTDILPDLALCDIDTNFILKSSDVLFQENRRSLIQEGRFGTLYSGQYHGKSVTVKKYNHMTSFNELQYETKLLQKLHHPCIATLIGISIHPSMTLIMERPPLGTLDKYIIKLIPRIVTFRIATQVAAALNYLHERCILLHSLRPSDILIWSLDIGALCHSKIANFESAVRLSPLGTWVSKSFSNSEALSTTGNERIFYTHKSDIFSYGLLLYEMITQRRPYYNVNPSKVNAKIKSGELPLLEDEPFSKKYYSLLAQIMKDCLKYRPEERPDTENIIPVLTGFYFQSFMGNIDMTLNKLSPVKVCAVKPRTNCSANYIINSELWLCCKGEEGLTMVIHDIRNETTNLSSLKEDTVQCMCECRDHIWMSTSIDNKSGVISIFNIQSHELVHTVHLSGDIIVSCMACSDTLVYMGTKNGYCFAFDMEVENVKSKNYRPQSSYISEHPINGITVTEKRLWVSHGRFIYFLNPVTLKLDHFYKKSQDRNDTLIGNLAIPSTGKIAWSANIGVGNTISVWDMEKEIHRYDINVTEALMKIGVSKVSLVVTCMTPVHDVLWVGLDSGHILLFHEQELVAFFSSVESCQVDFLVPVISFETHIIISCTNIVDDWSVNMSLWEAYTGTTIRQMKVLERLGSSYLNDYQSLTKTIRNLHFNDDIHQLKEEYSRDDIWEREDNNLIEPHPPPLKPHPLQNSPLKLQNSLLEPHLPPDDPHLPQNGSLETHLSQSDIHVPQNDNSMSLISDREISAQSNESTFFTSSDTCNESSVIVGTTRDTSYREQSIYDQTPTNCKSMKDL